MQTKFRTVIWEFLLLLVSFKTNRTMMLKFVVSCERIGWFRPTDCKVSSLFFLILLTYFPNHSNPWHFSNNCGGHFTWALFISQQVTKTDGNFIIACHNRGHFLFKYDASLPNGLSCQPSHLLNLFLNFGIDPVPDQGQRPKAYKFPNNSGQFV
jgi:hypothetical protein